MKKMGLCLLVLLGLYSSATAQQPCNPVDLLDYLETNLAGVTNAIEAGNSQASILAELEDIDQTVRTYHEVCHGGSPAVVATPTPLLKASQTIYARGSGSINVRAEASTTASVLGSVSGGTAIQSYGPIVGQNYGGSDRWFRINYNGQIGYIHSSVISTSQPAPAASSAQTNTAASSHINTQPVQQPPAATPIPRPANCDQARAMGLTAEQAAQWPHLDRDHDGVACYGD